MFYIPGHLKREYTEEKEAIYVREKQDFYERKTKLLGFPKIEELFLKKLNDLSSYCAIGVLQSSVLVHLL